VGKLAGGGEEKGKVLAVFYRVPKGNMSDYKQKQQETGLERTGLN